MKKGSKITENHRLKLRLAKLGKSSNFRSKKLSVESRNKMSLSRRAYFLRLNPNYSYLEKDILSKDRKKIRRERIRNSGGVHSVGEWEQLKAQYNWTCPSCKKIESEIKLTRDHIIPISKGGSDNIQNIQPLCNLCNVRKNTYTIKY